MTEQYLTTAEAAAELRVSEETIRRWCRAGRLPTVQIGRAHRIPLVAITAALAGPYPPMAEPAEPADPQAGPQPAPAPERISLSRPAARYEDEEEEALYPSDNVPLPAGWTRWNPDRDRARGPIIIG